MDIIETSDMHQQNVDEEESYWQALLEQGEFAPEAPPIPAWGLSKGGREKRGFSNDGHNGGAWDRSLRNGHSEDDRHEQDWRWLEEQFEKGTILRVRVIGCNRGGLLVRIREMVGFVPASQLANLPRRLGTEGLRQELKPLIGQELQVRLIELDRDRNRIILSERATEWGTTDPEELLSGIREGQVIKGIVRSVCEFGAFVDIGGIDGLIHISELSWQRVEHPSDVVKVGDEVEVLVLNVDHQQRRIGLSLKRLQEDPWVGIEERYHVGQLIEATITNVVEFGAFAQVEEGLEGLIHISELAEGHFLHPRNVVKEGDVVTLRILHIDSANRRLGLSLRQAWGARSTQANTVEGGVW